MARNYSSLVEPKALAANITSTSATTITLNNTTGLPSPPYVLVINPDTASEEVVLVTSNANSPTLTVTRAIEASGGLGIAKTHTSGNVVKHMIVGSDLQIVHDHFSATTGIHGLGAGVAPAPLASPTFTGTVTLPTGTVTSTMILDGTIVNADINASAAIDWTKLAISSTVSSTEIGYVDGVTSAIQTQLDAIKYPTTNAQTGTTYTLVLSDAGKYIEMNNATNPNTVIVPLNSSVAFPVGTEITIIQTGTGNTRIDPVSAGVTINYYSLTGATGTDARRIKAQWSAATLIKRATDTWVLIGNLL
jgi:hypothetical protein